MKSLALLLGSALALTACTATDLDDDRADLDDDLALAASADALQACALPEPGHIVAGHEADFYRCADDAAAHGAGCGPSGYLLGYGTRYAERFYRVSRPRMSARGQRWIDDVLVCLQRTLRDSVDVSTSCQDIHRVAFDSHPGCYVDAGFCTLPAFDVLNVLWTIDVRDWFGSDALRQAVRTAIGCGREYGGLIELWFAPFAH